MSMTISPWAGIWCSVFLLILNKSISTPACRNDYLENMFVLLSVTFQARWDYLIYEHSSR